MYITKYLQALWQFARPQTMILILLHGVVVYLFLTGYVPSTKDICLALIILIAAYVNAVSINDVSDQEVDKINLIGVKQTGDRPLINSTVSALQAWVIVTVSACVLVVACGLLNPWFCFAGIGMITLNATYSLPPLRVSYRGALAQALLPLMYVVLPALVAAMIAGERMTSVVFLCLIGGLYMIFSGRLFLKDIRDEKGDAKVGKRTYLVRHGLKPTLWQAAIWMTFGVGLTAIVSGQVLSAVVGVTAIAGTIWALVCCYRESVLDGKLLWVAMAGRWMSMWVFYLLTIFAAAQLELDQKQTYMLVLFTILIFIAGIGVLREELTTTRRQASKS